VSGERLKRMHHQVKLAVPGSYRAFGHDEKPHAQEPSMGQPTYILLRNVARWCHARRMFAGKSSENRLGHQPTEGNEVQVALAVGSLEAFGHDEKPHAQKPSMGHPKHILLRDVARWYHAQQMFTGRSSENRLGHPPYDAANELTQWGTATPTYDGNRLAQYTYEPFGNTTATGTSPTPAEKTRMRTKALRARAERRSGSLR